MRSVREESPSGANAVQRKEAPPQLGPGKQSAIHSTFPPIQRKSNGTAGLSDEQAHEAAQAGVSGPGGAMPHGDRIQAAFGKHDISGVKAHVGGEAAGASEAIGAQAYATGNNVAFGSSPDLHTAAHEAAHVVQQRSGVHLKGGIGAEGDDHEKHADAVADAVVAGKSAEGLLDQHKGGGAGEPAIQRRATTVADAPGSHAAGTDSIFDSRIKTGNKFKITAEIAAPDYNKVIAKYHEVIRPVGSLMAGHGFIDRKFDFPNRAPAEKNWGQKKKEFSGLARAELAMPANITLDAHPDFAYWKGLADAAKTPTSLLNKPEVGLLDPFVVTVEIKDSTAPAKPAWQVVTQFADSGCGYIKKIYNGTKEYGGEIATKGSFNADKDKDVGADKGAFKYSSTHDQGDESFDHRIAGMGEDKTKVGENGAGLDAVTWLAAEGARFAPVATLGAAGSPTSRYFVKPHADWTGYKYLTASDLMQSWLKDFGKAYNIPATKIAEIVNAKGKSDEAKPPKGVHFNLVTGARYDQA